ncbi:hypothetical protein BD410DRAFT_779479 [Rickenella mellea]|uniref:Prolyl endopeptidase n=1 Tax=Rickenella mellea TaxID=50990 RepID=A0A4R5XDL9_9AGAM|nr:hypothetical protein BD410DRAFT_779479 [Rickenella mellea]
MACGRVLNTPLSRSLHIRTHSIIRSLSSYPRTTRSNLGLRMAHKLVPTAFQPNTYPATRRSDHVDVYKSESKGEVRVHDPYHWLEENSEETDKWTSAQEAYTRQYLDQNEHRDNLEKDIRANTDFEKFSAPGLKKDGRWYWHYNSGLQAQYVLWRTKDSKLPDFSQDATAGGEIFFDSNLLTEDGTASIVTSAFSKCGKYWAYGISLSGSDFCTIYIRSTDHPFADVEKKALESDAKRLPDEIRFVKFSGITWTHDSKGFFYQRFDARESHGDATDGKAGTETDQDKNAMLYYHRVGTPQSEDVLVMKDEEHPDWFWSAMIPEIDGKYLMLYIVQDTSRKNLLWITNLEENEIGPNMKWIKVIDKYEAAYEPLENDGTKFYIRTNKDAPQHKLITIDIADPKLTQQEFIPEDKDAFLEDATFVNNDAIAIVYKRNVKDELYLYSLEGKQLKRLASDFVGTISASGRRDQSWFFATLIGFTTPGTVARYDFKEANEASRWSIFRTTIVKGLVPDDFIAEQVWYTSKDGTKVPMFIVRHKNTPKDGTAPAFQYGYGGFSISMSPFFSVGILTFLQRYRALLAVPNIRGGGEFGEEWHLAGTRDRKANVFDDFIAATQYLVDNKYAAPGKVAINGGSNGGLLIGACVNRAPEGTFGAAVAEVGVLDLLKFADFTIGKAWTSDYGDPHNPQDFDFIYPISPLHNVPMDKALPPTLLLTADHDDRVVPLHSFKHAATLQHTCPHNRQPLLIRVDKKAGHGAGKSTDQRIKEAADKFGFVAQSQGLQWFDS